ncbi:helix-turn-helix domain-containing protein [Halopelagius longus]|uniref:Predicted DNA binding protein, contains HTH domain n=1 Tax=Halopelagius longus TaxID=1236180 RepID=A0A1H1FZS4_9EURY|nr:helix-turn-helix domain-containing protein [Halopelagius longus]RDI69949.1 winged helix-turn-helix transcriptional regulator [Halopelagius longus]SDR06056.1 Predicted DNA binding protein, contains HTH domain [Halopelagius longus]
MRYATLVLTETDVQIAPVLDRFGRSESVAIESTRHMGPIEDGRYVVLVDLRGDLSAAERLLDAADEVLGYDVTGTDGSGVAYLRCRSVGLIGDLLSLLYAHDIVLDWPIAHREVDGRRGYRFTLIGTGAGIRRAVSELPAAVELELEEIGTYRPTAGEFAEVLTDGQAELLELAVREGYYEVPRETTHRELASELGLSAGTVSDRLQRIERRLVTAYVE